MEEIKYYDNSQLLSYNALLNFCLSGRGYGKSFNAKHWAIRDFLKNGNQFVYVRRYKEELKKSSDEFFKDVGILYTGMKFEVKGDKAYIDGKLCGYFIALSTAPKQKSRPFPIVNKIIFDEFIVDKGHIRYLNNEVETFLDLFETIARKRDNVRALFLANNVSLINPYFTYFKLRIKPNKRFTVGRDGLVVVEMYSDDNFAKSKKETKFGRLIEGTKYGDYAIDNKALNDNDSFIMYKKPVKSKFMFSFKIDSFEFGCWNCADEGIIYINNQVDTSSKYRYSVTKKDHEPNYIMLSLLKSHSEIKFIKECFSLGLIYYNNNETKQKMYEIFNLLSLK